MDQVISLLSSSPAVVSRPTNESLEASFEVLDSPLNAAPARADDSLFDYGDFLDSSATKRRRLSPALDKKTHTTDHITPLKSPGFMFSDITDFNSIGNTPDIPQAKSKAKETVSKTSTSWDVALDDPIVCSSSAPNNQTQEESSKKPITIVIDDDDDDENDDFLGHDLALSDDIDDNNDDEDLFKFDASQSSTFGISKKTTLLLEQLRREAESKSRSKKKKKVEDDFDSLSEADVLPSTKQKSVRRQPSSQTSSKNADKSAKALEREAAKLRRQEEKERQKEEKRKQKEEKEKQKRIAADIAEANKSKVDKAVSVGEMIVDISSNFQDTSIGTQTKEHMRNLGVEMNFSSSQIPNVVSWRRKVTAQFTDAGHWEPCAPTIKAEGHVLCFFTGEAFAEMAVAAPTSSNTVKAYFQKISGEYPSCTQIYLIEGLAATIRKGKNSRNRSYQAAVLQQIDNNQPNSGAAEQPPPPAGAATAATASSQSRRKKANSSKKTASKTHVIDEDAIEDALLQLQVVHSCLVHETANATESASWIKNFTEHISTVPYRRELMKSQDASFCMDVGQVRSGDDAGDAYVRMMQEVSRITAPIAYGVATQFPTVGKLVEAFDQGGALLLEDVKKCANKTGAVTDARIGPAISRRLYTIFTSMDPASSDV
ncbi:hypothetical protein H109_06366 [Trichophyton interdigitale MR816]|uniref:ERCC4 domain-containing protein n=1 Tax=Trichophyton interdigitale (strain MR816) TaxID=1215338 RepID=A0A059J2N4_TRIIM|nr:hypothetical protein H101_05663 [Trichophyton interdigitale H6]KDB21717.1 hypothetical protein H109_06366 [Trichophyton interdigitale MR816]